MRKKFRIIYLVIACVMIFTTTTQVAFAYPATASLNGFPVTIQSKSNWCWAACCSSVLVYYNHYVTQGSVYSFIHGGTNTNNTASMDQMQTALANWGVHSNIKESKVTFNSIESNIYSYQRPLLAGRYKSSTNSGHVVAICGYDIGATNEVQLMDPARTTKTYINYQTLVNNTSTGYKWVETLYQIY